MSNVYVDQGDKSGQDAAVLLLAAAEELDLPAGVVTIDTTGPNGSRFSAPSEVVSKAGLKEAKDPAEEVSDRLEGPTADFFAANKGEVKPEQKVATDETPGATTDLLGSPNPAADGQAGESQSAAREAQSEQKSEEPKAEAKKAPAKKAAAKKTTAKKAAAKKTSAAPAAKKTGD